MKKQILFLLLITVLLSGCSVPKPQESLVKEGDYRAIAYVTVPASENWRWIGEDGETVTSAVDTRYVTHINFAFGMIEVYQYDPGYDGRPLMSGNVASKEAYKDPSDGNYHYRATVNGWIEEMKSKVNGEPYLHALVALKEQKPDLNVLLSIGGWDSDGFCYMAQTPEGRNEFIESCMDLIDEFQLDGIDLDWEYPNNGGWGTIASCPTCEKDGLALLKEFRAKLDERYPDKHKLLTIASGIPWVDEDGLDTLDYMNVMCYDYDSGSGRSQAPMSYVKDNMKKHIHKVKDTPEHRAKLNLGIPFYNEGGPYLVPHYKEWDGFVDASPKIAQEKMNWVKENGYGGGFYWAYSMDKFEQDVEDPDSSEIKELQRTVYETLNGEVK